MLLQVPFMHRPVPVPILLVELCDRWFRFATYHKRMLGLDFNWNPFSGRPNQSDNQRNCSLSVGSETAEEEHR